MRILRIFGLTFAIGLLVAYFQNCSQPYNLHAVANPSITVASVSEVSLLSPAITNNTQVQLQFNRPISYEMYVTTTADCGEGGVWQPYASQATISLDESDGVYPISVMFRSTTGQETNCITMTVTLDQTPPIVILSPIPATVVNKSPVSIGVNAEDNLSGVKSVKCTLNGQLLASCSDINSMTLADASYTFSATATDNAGNVSSPATVTWMLDTSAPSITMSSAPSAFTNSTSVVFSFIVSDPKSSITAVNCSLDGAAAAACESPRQISGLSNGTHTFTIQVADAAGNGSSLVQAFMVDTVPPLLSWVQAPPRLGRSQDPNFVWSAQDNVGGSGIANVECSVDGSAPVVCASPWTTHVSDGNHTVQASAFDNAGNVTSISTSFVVDSTPPTISVSSNPNIVNWLNGGFTLSFTLADSGSGVNPSTLSCTLDGQPWTALCPPGNTGNLTVPKGTLSNGSHSFSISVSDNAGNVATYSAQLKIDTVPPTSPVLIAGYPPSTALASGVAVFAWYASTDATSGVAGYQCQLNSEAPQPCDASVTYTSLGAGSYEFHVIAVDNAGNQSAPLTSTFTVP